MRYAVAALVLLTPAGFAGDRIDTLREQAEAFVKEGKLADAGEAYGQALAHTHKKNDLVAENKLVESLRNAWRERRRNLLRQGVTREDGRHEVLPALLRNLDPKRSGAFVSAHLVATQLLFRATAEGDPRHVEEAAKVLEIHAGRPKVGKCAKAMADYGAGMVALASKDHAAASAALERALTVMVEEAWPDLAMYVGTELVATYVKQGEEKAAVRAMENVATTLPPDADTSVSYIWRRLVEKRLKEAPESVLAPYDRAIKPHMGSRSVGAAGGRGGRGASSPNPTSKVGEAWRRYSHRKPLVTVKRTPNGFLVREGFDKRFKWTQNYQHGVKHHDDGGITLSFWGHGTTLAMVDLKGTRGQPGESSEPVPFQFFYRLARNETWGVTKGGVVIIIGG